MKTIMNKKTIAILILLFGTVTASFAQNNDPFSTINDGVAAWIPGMKSLFNTLIILGILIGGVFTFYKMKTGEGSEGKKAVLNFIAAILFAVTVRVFLGIFGG